MNNATGILTNVMSRLLLTLFLLFSPLLVQAKFVALVIGNEAYRDAPLLNPANDADAVAKAFNSMGYESVTLVKDANTIVIDTALDEFSKVAASADVAVIYYAGHGVQIDGKNYLVPVDVSMTSSRDIHELTTQKELTEEVARARQFGLVILDACRDNPFSGRVAKTRSRSTSESGLARDESAYGSNTLVAYATASDDVAADGTDRNSPYTTALLSHLTNPQFDIYQLFGKVRDTVMRNTDGLQVPYHYGSTGGGRYFLHPVNYSTQGGSESGNAGSGDTITSTATPISLEDLLIASSRVETFKNVLVRKDWTNLSNSRSLSAAARQRIDRWRESAGELTVNIENLRARARTQTIYADLVVSGVARQPDRVTVQVIRNRNGNWSGVYW